MIDVDVRDETLLVLFYFNTLAFALNRDVFDDSRRVRRLKLSKVLVTKCLQID